MALLRRTMREALIATRSERGEPVSARWVDGEAQPIAAVAELWRDGYLLWEKYPSVTLAADEGCLIASAKARI
jgi:hypothetical protein